MFDVGFFELLVILAVAFIALKPEDFVRLAHKMGTFFKTIKAFQSTIKDSYKPLLEELEVEEVAKKAQRKAAKKEPLTHMKTHDDT